MTLNEYQQNAKKTDLRDSELLIKGVNMICDGFGLIGETHELQAAKGEKGIFEAGDVLWYVALTALDLGQTLEEVLNRKPRTPKRNLSEVFKKVYRDNKGIFDGQYKEDILDHLRNLIIYIDATYNLVEVMDKNIEKLFSRKERGKIKGDGDNR